jgi:5-methylcytosine-specific restriction endonuclease McrA
VLESSLEFRKCNKCGEEKKITDFPPAYGKYKGKYHSRECSACRSARQKINYLNNIDHKKAQDRERYYKDIEKSRAANRSVYERRKLKARKECTDRYWANLEVHRKRQRDFKKKWAKEHPFESKLHSKKQRAQKRNAQTEPITKKQIENLFSSQRGRCPICKKKLDKYHIDHVTPLSKGGAHSVKNFQLLCPPCNLAKSNHDPIDFMQKLGFLL